MGVRFGTDSLTAELINARLLWRLRVCVPCCTVKLFLLLNAAARTRALSMWGEETLLLALLTGRTATRALELPAALGAAAAQLGPALLVLHADEGADDDEPVRVVQSTGRQLRKIPLQLTQSTQCRCCSTRRGTARAARSRCSPRVQARGSPKSASKCCRRCGSCRARRRPPRPAGQRH